MSKREFHTHIHLNQARVEFYLVKKKKEMLYLPIKREKINNLTIMIFHSLEISKLFINIYIYIYIYFNHVLTYSKGINNI